MNARMTNILLITIAIGLSACGKGFRTVEEASENMMMGPKSVDTDLSASLNANVVRDLRWETPSNSGSLYQILNQISDIEMQFPSAKLKSNLQKSVDAEITYGQTPETDFVSGDYFRLLVTNQGLSTAAKLTKMKAELQAGLEKVIARISTWTIPQISENQPLAPVVSKIFTELETLVAWMKAENMNSSLIQALETYSKLKGTIVPKIGAMDNDQNLQGLVQKILDLVATLKVTLPAATAAELNQALSLGQNLNQMRTSTQALAALVQVWRMLPAADRYATFSKSNKDLADLFKDSSNSDLDCFASIKSCGLINYAKKEWFVLPGIEDKGVLTIRNDLHTQALARTRAKIIDMINSKTKDLASTGPALIREKFAASTAILDLMISNFAGTMAERLQKQGFRESTLRNRQFLSASVQTPTFFARSSVAGFIPTLIRRTTKATTVNESLFLGSLSQAAGEHLDPNLVTIHQEPNLSASELAQALENNARWIQDLRRESMGTHVPRVAGLTAQTLFPESQSEFLQNMKIFPRGAMAALVLSRSARLLEVFKKDNSPAFLVSTTGQLQWSNTYKSGTVSTAASGAVIAGGIVDRVQGERKKTVASKDVARMLSALSLFIESLEGIESLIADYADVAIIKSGRDNARSLTISFANYLSNQLRREDGLIIHELDYATGKATSNEIQRLDQALAVRAFMDAQRALGIEIYKWEAVDTYFAMNKRIFNRSTGFYYSSTQATQTQMLPEFLETLNGIMAVRSALGTKSRSQFDQIVTPWLSTLEQIELVTN